MQNRIISLAAALLLGVTASAAPALITHPGLASEKIDGATVKSVFLGKKVAWDGGSRVVLAVLKTGPVADEFLKSAVDMNASAFSNHWRRLAMTGGGTAPKSFDKEEELRKFVAETPGAVGFLDSAQADNSVRVVPSGS
jgi:hypothetical protein